MKPRMRTALGLAAAFAALALSVGLLRPVQQPPEAEGSAPASASSATASSPRATASDPAALLASASSPEEAAALVAALRTRYGAKLASPLVQMKLIEALVREFRARGGEWRGSLLATLRRAFPEAYPRLAARLDQWLAYEAWMQEHAGDLQRLEPEDRRANLWARREALFGEDAKEIWAAELRHEQVTRALAAIDAAPAAPLPERLQRYRESLQEAYGEKADAVLARHRQEALDRFLDLGSVQQELGALAPGQRAAQLREIRAGLGLDAQALQRWEALDGARDARWDAGARYMAERELLLREAPGPAREARLTALRERLFGAEAATLAAEEASGFLRFEQARRWGRN